MESFHSRKNGSDLRLSVSKTLEEPVHVGVMLSSGDDGRESTKSVGDVLSSETETGAGLKSEDFGGFCIGWSSEKRVR